MKLCTGCNLEKSEDAFWKNQGRCKECRREYDRVRYQTHYKQRRRKAEGDWHKKLFDEVTALKARSLCADCGNSYHPVAMDFDHLPGQEKLGNVSALIGSVSRDRLMAEIAKCDIVCANCHRVRSYERNEIEMPI